LEAILTSKHNTAGASSRLGYLCEKNNKICVGLMEMHLMLTTVSVMLMVTTHWLLILFALPWWCTMWILNHPYLLTVIILAITRLFH